MNIKNYFEKEKKFDFKKNTQVTLVQYFTKKMLRKFQREYSYINIVNYFEF